MSSYDEQTARLRRQEAALQLAAALVSLLVMSWYLVPEHQRRAARMRAALIAHRCFRLAAAAAGRQAIAAEAATGVGAYGLPYALALARERCARYYRQLRQGT